MQKYSFATFNDLSADMLQTSSKRWSDREELRFIIRNDSQNIVGMIGVDLIDKNSGELWYFKISTCSSFMSEVLQVVLGFIKAEGVLTLLASYKVDNFRTVKVLESLNFEKTEGKNEMRYQF